MECLVYVALFAVVTGLAFAAFYRADQSSRDLHRNANEILRVVKTGELWRQDVRQATAPLQLIEGPDLQLLRVPQGTNEVWYEFANEEIRRRATPSSLPVTLVPKLKSSYLQIDQRQVVSSWRWEVELKTKEKVPRIKPVFTFQAVAPAYARP